jgi:molybdenum cofactor synthesis domain-containing protein
MCPARRGYRILAGVLAAILTIGNEVVCGDVENTNAVWLAQRLEALGVRIVLAAAVPDEIEAIAEFVRRERDRVDHLVVTGGLGGTPDDITREAISAAFAVGQVEVPELAAELRTRFSRHPDYAARWAHLPDGSRPLSNPHGGAPGFVIRNVWVLPGLPTEMEAMFDLYADELRGEQPISSWRRAYRTRESDIVHVLAGATVRWPQVRVGSYPRFLPEGPEVEIVLKSAKPDKLAEAVAWLEPSLAEATADKP